MRRPEGQEGSGGGYICQKLAEEVRVTQGVHVITTFAHEPLAASQSQRYPDVATVR